MTTYNGERFLQEQLDSFLQQTCLPDELVVCDDGSHDRTIAILESFSSRAPFPVRIYRNNANLGYSKNFEKAGSLCTGDIIAFSDQDDVWDAQKLEKFAKIMTDDPEVGFIFCDADIVDEELNSLGFSFWNFHNISKTFAIFSKGELLDYFFNYDFILGAVTAIRKCIYTSLVPIPPSWVYDDWLPFASSVVSKVVKLPYEFNKYRKHINQSCGLRKINRSIIEKIIDNSYKDTRAHFFNKEIKWLNGFIYLYKNNLIDGTIMRKIDEVIFHCDKRANIPYNIMHRIPFILNEIISGRYHKFYKGWRSAFRDLISI
jgi:glycosyltransferase involved in cell wall biosynthesis